MFLRITVGDIWNFVETHRVVIPTNLQGPMGKGLALQAKERYLGLENYWKKLCRAENKDIIYWYASHCRDVLVLFPVKVRWREKADLTLIEHSLEQLSLCNEPVAIPQIGCGFGERNWDREIRPLVEKYLGNKDNFLVVLAPTLVRLESRLSEISRRK